MLQLVQASAARPSLAERIAVDPEILAGQSAHHLRTNYPGPVQEDILTCSSSSPFNAGPTTEGRNFRALPAILLNRIFQDAGAREHYGSAASATSVCSGLAFDFAFLRVSPETHPQVIDSTTKRDRPSSQKHALVASEFLCSINAVVSRRLGSVAIARLRGDCTARSFAASRDS